MNGTINIVLEKWKDIIQINGVGKCYCEICIPKRLKESNVDIEWWKEQLKLPISEKLKIVSLLNRYSVPCLL